MTGPTPIDVFLGPGDWQPRGALSMPPSQGFYDVRECELCGDIRPLRVWALPGFPMSVGGCFQCWYMDCLPLWLIVSLGEARHGFGPDWRDHVHDHVLDMHVFKGDEYVRIGDLP